MMKRRLNYIDNLEHQLQQEDLLPFKRLENANYYIKKHLKFQLQRIFICSKHNSESEISKKKKLLLVNRKATRGKREMFPPCLNYL